MRSRAADALGKIGGPKVIDAVLQLVRDKDEDIRRAAIEILNQTKDERAVDSLIQATRDPDWWVSERAIDALAEIGSKRAVPRLMEMLHKPAMPRRPRSWCARSASSAKPSCVDMLLPLVARPEREIRIEAIQALSKLADERHADQVRGAADAGRPPRTRPSRAWRRRRSRELDNRIAGIRSWDRPRSPVPSGIDRDSPARAERRAAAAAAHAAEAAKTLLMSEAALAAGRKQAEARRAWTSPRSSPATSSRGATSTSTASAAAPSAPCC